MRARRLLFVAGPYAAPTRAGIDENVRCALAVGRYAIAQGYAAIVPHAQGHQGLYGDPCEADDGTCRAVALECSVALAMNVAVADGDLWVIARDDGSLSDGTRLELDAYTRAAGTAGWAVVRDWAQWLGLISVVAEASMQGRSRGHGRG